MNILLFIISCVSHVEYFLKKLYCFFYIQSQTLPDSLPPLHTNIPFLIRMLVPHGFVVRYLLSHNISRPARTDCRKYVVHIISNIEIGGSQKLLYDIINGTHDSYCHFIVDLQTKIIFHCHDGSVVTFSSPQEILGYIRSLKTVLVHVHYYGDLFGMHAFLEELAKIRKPIIENMNNPIAAYRMSAVSSYIYVSKYALQIQEKMQPNDMVIYPGLNIDTPKPRLRRESDVIRVGMVYRLTYDKLRPDTIDMLIEIAKRLQRKVEILVVGDGYAFWDFVRKTERTGLKNIIIYYGYVPYESLDEYYRHIDVFIAPLHSESYGIVVPYAMAHRVPIVAMNIGALPEILGPYAFLCDNAETFVQKVCAVVKSKRLRTMHTTKAYDRVKEKFLVSTMIGKYASVYDRYFP